ncbi:MAG: response regulator [Solirubrobacteraceae bacterium]
MRVVIGEDQALLREGLAMLLANARFEVAALAADAPALERAALDHRPDLVVADIRMPPENTDDGLRAALRIRARLPATAVLVLSQHVQPRYATDLLAHGANGVGYLLKQRVADVDSFVADARRVTDGGTALDPEIVAAMLTRRNRRSEIESLTPRQREVLALMAQGRSNGAIAHHLTVTEKAVVNHVTHIYDRLALAPNADDHRRVLAVVRHLTSEP